jgi:hypothetical protein
VLVKAIEEKEKPLLCDLEAKLVINKTLELIQTRFFEVVKVSNSLNKEARNRLLRQWEAELASFSSAFIGRSVTEWL